MHENTIFTSEPMVIGRSGVQWRILVKEGNPHWKPPDVIDRWTCYEFKYPDDVFVKNKRWQDSHQWPSYDFNDTYSGLPRSLAKLYDKNKVTIKDLMKGFQT